MDTLSPMSVARRCVDSLDPNSDDSFAVLRQAVLDLAEQVTTDTLLDGRVVAASNSVRTLISRSLDDVTKAVPWDNRDVLRPARQQVIELMKVALENLAKLDNPNSECSDVFAGIGAIQAEYAKLVEQLNDSDRTMLEKMQGSGL